LVRLALVSSHKLASSADLIVKGGQFGINSALVTLESRN